MDVGAIHLNAWCEWGLCAVHVQCTSSARPAHAQCTQTAHGVKCLENIRNLPPLVTKSKKRNLCCFLCLEGLTSQNTGIYEGLGPVHWGVH